MAAGRHPRGRGALYWLRPEDFDLTGIVASGCVEWMRRYSAMIIADFLRHMDPPLAPHITGDKPGSNRDTRHAQPRLSVTTGGSLENVPEMTYWVLCCICLVDRHGCPLGRTQCGPSIGPASHSLAVARPHIGMRDTPSQRHSPSVSPGRSGYFAPPGSLATRRGVRLRAAGQVTAGTR